MYDASSNIPAEARTATLNEELGQIDYIFSDKTGTLTQVDRSNRVERRNVPRKSSQNIMTFKQCSIRGRFYGEIETINANDNNEDSEHFFSRLTLFHTMVSEEKNGKIIYQAESSNEIALVIATRTFEFEFLVSVINFTEHKDHRQRKDIQNRTWNSITVRCRDQVETYELLNIVDFSNYRKRMSIRAIHPCVDRSSSPSFEMIVRKHDQILLYCNGADIVIKEQLASPSRGLLFITNEHLHVGDSLLDRLLFISSE